MQDISMNELPAQKRVSLILQIYLLTTKTENLSRYINAKNNPNILNYGNSKPNNLKKYKVLTIFNKYPISNMPYITLSYNNNITQIPNKAQAE